MEIRSTPVAVTVDAVVGVILPDASMVAGEPNGVRVRDVGGQWVDAVDRIQSAGVRNRSSERPQALACDLTWAI